MPDADSNLRVIRYSAEAVWGETPASPAMTEMRSTGDTLAHQKSQTESEEIRQDRMVPSIIEMGTTMEGAVNIEFSCTSYDTFLEATLGGTWTTYSLSGLTLTLTAATKILNRSAGSWITDGVKVGNWILIGGVGINVGNAGPFKVAAVTATDVTLFDPNAAITDDSITAGTVKARYLRNGNIKRSFLIEKEFTDITEFISFRGLRVNQFSLALQAQQKITGSFSFMGKQGVRAVTTVAGSSAAATTTPNLGASADVATLLRNGALITDGLTQLNLTLNNNLRHRPIVGSKFDDDIGYGRLNVGVQATALVRSLSLFLDVINHTTIGLDIPLFDQGGKFFYLSIPALKSQGNPQTPAGNQDVTIQLDMNAQRDPVTNCMVEINTIV
jgi:hypothetical protein